jgi:hypothetical protein
MTHSEKIPFAHGSPPFVLNLRLVSWRSGYSLGDEHEAIDDRE